MANYFDKFDNAPTAENYFDKFDAKPPVAAAPSAGYSTMDTLKSAAQGAVGATKSMLEGFGAGNAPAEYLEGVSKSIGASMSPERRAEQARRAALEKEAAVSGSAMKEIATGIGGVTEAPIQSVAQGIGSSIPTVALGLGAAALGATLGAPVALAAAVGLGTKYLLGALQGAGEVKGSIYDAVYQGLKAKGVNDVDAKAQALKSQEYIGDNWGTISTAAGIGGVAAGTGVEKQLTKLFTKPAVSKTVEEAAKRGTLRKAATEFGKEALPEGAQAGQEKYAENVALTRAGMETPAMQGVLGAAARDALVGGLTGAAVSTTQRGKADLAEPEVAPEVAPSDTVPATLAKRSYPDIAKEISRLSQLADTKSATPDEMATLKGMRQELQSRGVAELAAQRKQVADDTAGIAKVPAIAGAEPQQTEMRAAMEDQNLPPQTDLFGNALLPKAEQDSGVDAAVAPTPEELEAAGQQPLDFGAITEKDIKQAGATMSAKNRAWLADNVLGKTPEQVRDIVTADPTLVSRKSGVATALKGFINALPTPPAQPIETGAVRDRAVVPVPAEPTGAPVAGAPSIAPPLGVVPAPADVARPPVGEVAVPPAVVPATKAPETAKKAIAALTALTQDARTMPATKRAAIQQISLLQDKDLNSTPEDRAANLGLAAKTLGFDVKAGVIGPKVAPEIEAPRVSQGMFGALVKEGAPDLVEDTAPAELVAAHRPDWSNLLTSEEMTADRAARTFAVRKKRSVGSTGVEGPAQTVEGLASSIASDKSFIGQRIQRLLASGKLKLADTQPEDATIGGEYDGKTVTLYASGIRAGSEFAVILHEIGAHMGLEKMLGTENYKQVVAQIRQLATSKENTPERALAQAAISRIPEGTDPKHIDDEIIAYFVETVANMEAAGALPKMGALRQMWTQFKALVVAAVNRALGTQFGLDDLSPQDIAAMARAALIQESYSEVIQGELATPKRSISPASQAVTAAMNARAPTTATKRPTSAEVRTMIVDSMASVVAKLNKQFQGAVRSPTGKLNPVALMRQAADTGKFLTSFVMQGGFRKNALTGSYEVFSDPKIKPPAEIFNILDRMAKAAGISPEKMQNHASVVLEGVRLHGLRAAYAKTGETLRSHMTDAQIDTQMASYNATPELKEISDIMDTVRKGLVDHMERVGRITPEMAKEWRDVIGYVPFDRLSDVAEHFAKSKKPSGKGIGQFGKIPEFVGSFSRPVGNVFENYIGTIGWMMRQVTTTDATRSALEVLADMGEAKRIGPNKHASKTGITQLVYEKGMPVYYDLQTKYDKYAFADQAPPPVGMVKIASKISNVLRLSVTALPPFALKQVVEDVQRAVFNSGVERPASLIAPALRDFFKIAVAEWRGQIHPIVRKLGSKGLVGEVDFNPNETGEFVMKQMGLKKRTLLGSILHKLEGITRASDLAVRNAVYEQTKKETQSAQMPSGDILLAETRARELINFRRKGASASVGLFVSTIPFFNAYLQGTDLVYRNAMGTDSSMGISKAEAAKQFRNRAAMVFGFSLMYAIAKSDDDDYKKMDLRTRNGNWIVGDGIKIPVPGELSALFKVPAEAIVEYFKRQGTPEQQQETEAVNSVLGYIFEQYMGRVTPIPQAVKPLMEAFLNHSFMTGRDLEGQHQQTLLRHLRKSGATSGLATKMTEFLSSELKIELSPIKVDAILDGYLGSASALTKMLTDGVLNPNKPGRPLEKWMLLSNYMYETGDSTGTRPMDEFYKLNEQTSMAAATMNKLAQTDVNAAIKYGQEHASEIKLNKTVQHTLMSLAKLRKTKNILSSPNGAEIEPDKAKRDAMIKELAAIELQQVKWVREVKTLLDL